MLLKNKKSPIALDTLGYFPIIPGTIDKTYITKDLTLNHWKINNSLTFIPEGTSKELKIDFVNEDGTPKTALEIYKMLESWEKETLFNAFFNGDFEAGNIKGGGENIEKLVVKRLSSSTGYRTYEILGEIPFSKEMKHVSFKDYLIASGEVYLYSIQPVTEKNHYGALQKPVGGLNRYEYGWLVDTDGSQIEILNASLNSMNIITKDGIVETIGREAPYVNRFSNLKYKTFTITGTIASIFDSNNHITPEVDRQVYTDDENIQQVINGKFLEKTGASPKNFSNSMRVDYNYERVFRDKIVNILTNGHKKIFKSPTEGLVIVKLSNVTLTPKQNVNRIIYDFSANATQIEDFDINSLDDFDLKNIIKVE